MSIQKVIIGMSDKDLNNVDTIEKILRCKTKADAVGAALSIKASLLSRMIETKAELLLRKPDGTIFKVLIPGIGN